MAAVASGDAVTPSPRPPASNATRPATRPRAVRAIPNFNGSYLVRFPLVLADIMTSDHLSKSPRSIDGGANARGTFALKRRRITLRRPRRRRPPRRVFENAVQIRGLLRRRRRRAEAVGPDLRPAELVAVPKREVERRDRREGRRERVFPEGPVWKSTTGLGGPHQTLYLGHIEVDLADFWTNRLLSSTSRSTADSFASKRSHTRTLKSG